MPQRVIFLKHFYRRCHNLWNDKDRPILGSLSKHRSRWERVGSSQISDICSFISLPLFHFISFLWNGIGIEYFFTSTSQFVTYIFGILTKLWVFSFFPFSSEAAAVVEKRASYVTEKVFLLHDLLPQPVRLKSPETVVGLQDLAKKLKLFPLSLPVLPRKTQMTNIWMTKHFNTWVEFCEMKARWRKSCHISGGVIEGNTWRTLAQWPPENRPEPI